MNRTHRLYNAYMHGKALSINRLIDEGLRREVGESGARVGVSNYYLPPNSYLNSKKSPPNSYENYKKTLLKCEKNKEKGFKETNITHNLTGVLTKY